MGQRPGNVLRHGFPLNFVVGKNPVPVRGGVSVKRDRDMGGPLVLHHVEQRVGKDEQRGSVYAFGGEDRPADQRKVRAIDQRHAIEQKELFRHGRRVTRRLADPN